jgi:uncharacterized protein (DUF1778 family)
MTSEQEALIKQASEAEGTTVTEFTVAATVARARDVLADRRLFSLSPSAWTEFLAVLDRPVVHKPALAKLLSDAPIFEDED